jgi:deazaflavin-dependent oxidoreductase (nitroreductase family)
MLSMPLYYVDPDAKHGLAYRAGERFGRSRVGRFLSRRVLFPIDPWLYRVTSGRYPRVFGVAASAPLTSTGAKSGLQRVSQLTYFHDGPSPILIASYHGGPRHPQWYYNLKAHPECEFGGDKFVANEVTDPIEYARLYGLAEQVYAGYSDYRVTTASVGRRIPVFRLESCPK